MEALLMLVPEQDKLALKVTQQQLNPFWSYDQYLSQKAKAVGCKNIYIMSSCLLGCTNLIEQF